MFTRQMKAVTGFTKMAAADILSRATAVYAGLNGNPAYPTPPVDMPTFKAAIDGYSSGIAGALDGGRRAILERDNLGDAVVRMLRQLAHYVEVTCKDDMTIFASSGFQAVSTARNATPPLSQAIRKIDSGKNSGELLVTVTSVRGAVSYDLRWAPVVAGATPGAWASQPVSNTRPPSLVSGLTPGTLYAFQVRALGRSRYTDWSDSVTRMAT